MDILEQKEYIETSVFAGEYNVILDILTALRNLENVIKGETENRHFWFDEYKRVKALAEERLNGWESLAINSYLPKEN